MVDQRYVSDELTHFVGKDLSAEEQFKLLIDRLKTGILGLCVRPPIGSSQVGGNFSRPLSSNECYLGSVTCFCDIPLGDLDLHMAKYSKFGIAFKKTFMLKHGAMPLFYIPQSTIVRHCFPNETAAQCFNSHHKKMLVVYGSEFMEMVREKKSFSDPNPLFELVDFLATFVFSYCKFFDVKLDDTHQDNYYMEREWRILGRLEFSLGDVSRVIFPQEFASRFREELPDYIGQVTFS